jgi:hypothetical protein
MVAEIFTDLSVDKSDLPGQIGRHVYLDRRVKASLCADFHDCRTIITRGFKKRINVGVKLAKIPNG